MKSSLGNAIATALVLSIAASLSQFSACGLSGPLGDHKIEPVIYDKISLTTYPSALSRAGRVIARDNGALDFVPFVYCRGANPCPSQLEAIVAHDNGRMLEQSLHFVELPVRSLRDRSWVVARDPLQYARISNDEASRASRMGRGIRVLHQIPPGKRLVLLEHNGSSDYVVADDSLNLAAIQLEAPISAIASLPLGSSIVEIDLDRIDASQWGALARILGSRFDVHRLKDFATKTLAHNFNYMLRLESDPNSKLVDDIDALGLNTQAVLASRTTSDTVWAHEHQGHGAGIHFTARVRSPVELDDLLTLAPSYGDKLWAIQVDKSDRTAEMVKAINATQYLSYVDATPYDSQHETSTSACPTTLVALNSNVTTTLRPLDCLSKMRVFKPW